MNDNNAGNIRRELLRIRDTWPHMLPDAPKPTTTGTIGRNTGATEHPGPIPVTTLDTRATTRARLAGWCLLVIEDRELNTHINSLDTHAMCRFLDTHADYLAAHPAASDVLDELSDSADKCERIANPPSALEFVGRCEVCDGDLRSRGGRALCRDCGNVVDAEVTRQRLTEEALDRIMSAAEIVTLAPRMWPDVKVTHVHLHRWVKGGHLTSPGQVQCDDGALRPGYKVRDVEQLAMRHATSRRSA